MKGHIKNWNLQRGFGFVAATNGRDYFLHIKNWGEANAPVIGSQVYFEVGPGDRGKKEQAVNARIAGVEALGHGGIATLISGAEGV